MAFSPPEYCRLFAQKKAYQGGVTGTLGPPLATPLLLSPFVNTEVLNEAICTICRITQIKGDGIPWSPSLICIILHTHTTVVLLEIRYCKCFARMSAVRIKGNKQTKGKKGKIKNKTKQQELNRKKWRKKKKIVFAGIRIYAANNTCTWGQLWPLGHTSTG